MATSIPQTQVRETGYDVLRVVAMVAVVATHVVMVYRSGVSGADVTWLWDSVWFPLLAVATITLLSLGASALLSGRRSTAWLIGHGNLHAPRRTTIPGHTPTLKPAVVRSEG